MKKVLLLLALSAPLAFAQVPAPNVQTQAPVGGNTPPSSPGQTMGAPVPDTNAPPTASQTSGLLSPPPDNPPAVTPSPAPAPALLTPAPVTTTTTTTTTTGAHHVSHSEIERIQEQEVIRRQEMVFRANQEMTQGRKDELAQKYPDARAHYLFAVQVYGSISHTSDAYHRAAEGLDRVDMHLYDSALQAGDTARAKMLIDEVVLYNPDDKVALEKQERTNEAINNPNDTGILGNPAVTPGLVKKVNEINDLFAQSEQFRRTGQYDEAEARLKRVLGIDPYNITATRLLERIMAEKNQYAEHARLETREERLRQVEETWYQPITNKDTLITAQEEQAPITRTTNFDIDQKLKSIFLSLDFTDVSIEQATNFLYTESKRLDEPTHKGIPFIIQPDASTTAKTITLSLNNVPVVEALRYICQLANVKYKVQDYAVSIVPFSASTDDLISRTFVVQPSFVAAPETTPAGGDLGNASSTPVRPIPGSQVAPVTLDSVQAVLEAKGVKFPTGASAVYTPSTNTLTVVNTADQMELIEELVNGAQAPTLMVRIATKFVEINQVDLNDLTFNGALNLLGVTGGTSLGLGLASTSPTFLTLPSMATSLPGANAFASDSIDALISPTTLTENQLSIRGSLSGLQYAAVITALSQKRSFDLLSEPTALTKSGEQATMEAIRIFPYPVAFDPPELVTITNSSSSSSTSTASPPAVIATTPTDFKRRNIGVRLVIKPQITADDKTVDLSLFPEVTDFEGFIDYGSQINIGNPDGTTSLLSTNTINQPVFNTRRINTKVLIHDGSTVVLGGLIREDLQTVNDKVPILGDLPFIGRLFQSKATESDKRNLIIFVTANIYQNDGELLNPPEPINAAEVLTGKAAAYSAPPSGP